MPDAPIARRVGPIAFDGVRTRTLQTFRASFASTIAKGSLVVADLSLGTWQSHQTATEFAAQLGLKLPSVAEPEAASTPEPIDQSSLGDIIGRFVDLEGRGDITTLAALKHAARIASAGGGERVFAIVAPRFGLGWERDDVLFIRFLAQALEHGPDRVFVVGADRESMLPGDFDVRWDGEWAECAPEKGPSLLGLVPGVVAPEAMEALALVEMPNPGDWLPLGNGYLLVAPETRQNPRHLSRFEYDKLAFATRRGGWLHAYAQFHGNNFYVDPWFLWWEAYRQVQSGGYTLALRLADRAAECARDPRQLGALQSLAQGIRIASQRFAEAGSAPDPAPALPVKVRRFLLEAKGWALAMMNEPDQAEPYLQAADALFQPPDKIDREYLYLLNIRALNRLKLRDAEGALAFEKRIEADRAGLPCHDSRLEYINSINIARLAKRRGDYEEAETCYSRAFAGTLGARTEGDRIYTNVCLALLGEDRGRADDAFRGWMRASLHWAAAVAPEALASRVATAIVERKIAPGETDPEEISAALEARLSAAVAATGADCARSESEPPVFAHIDQFDTGSFDTAILGNGWSVVMTALETRPALESRSLVRLRRLLVGLLGAAWTPNGLGRAGTIVLDDCFGTELPTTLPQFVAMGVRLRVRTLVGHGRRIDLDEPACGRVERDLQVHLGPAIQDMRDHDGVSVLFKRYLPPRALNACEIRVMNALTTSASIEQLHERAFGDELPNDQFLTLMRRLERSRVLEFELPEKSLQKTGLFADLVGLP